MAEGGLDRALPVVRNLAKRKANAFARRFPFVIDEREDIESHLVLTFIIRWPKFDRERASVQTFASRLMDKELMSVLRYRLAQGRQPREIPERDMPPASIPQFRVDIERAMAPLPEVFRKTASALSWCSAVDVAAVLGCSRQTVNVRKRQIRDALIVAGIRPDYFAGRGTQP